MRKLQRTASPRQAGFIQNFIIPGIILIGLVIAGIAMLSSGSSTNTDNEKASMLANVVMTQSLTVTGAIQRAEADGAIGAAAGVQDLTVSLITPKYLTMGAMPTLPPELASAAWVYTKADFGVKASGADLGTTAAEDVLRVTLGADNVAKATCLRINNKLYGTSTLLTRTAAQIGLIITPDFGTKDATAGGTEGCATSGANFIYYKAVNIR